MWPKKRTKRANTRAALFAHSAARLRASRDEPIHELSVLKEISALAGSPFEAAYSGMLSAEEFLLLEKLSEPKVTQ